MDILMIFPPISVEERYGVSEGREVAGQQAPLGMAYIAAYLEERGFSVGIIDAPALDMSIDDVLRHVKDEKPNAIGISSLTPNFNKAVMLAEKIKQCFPEMPILLGGQHATIMKEKILEENNCFDILVYGEGEITAYELMELNKKGRLDSEHLKKVKGILFRNKKR